MCLLVFGKTKNLTDFFLLSLFKKNLNLMVFYPNCKWGLNIHRDMSIFSKKRDRKQQQQQQNNNPLINISQ